MKQPSWRYDRAEMVADGVVHVIGVALALTGAVVLVVVNLWRAEPSLFVATAIYALTLVATLTMSAVYNMWPVSPFKWKLRKCDHAAIFLLIAGTYTPFAQQAGATGLLIFIWTVAAIGFCLKIAFAGRFDRLAVLLYLGLGWSGVGLFRTLYESFPPIVLVLLLTGGIVYSVGVIFYLWEQLRFQNAIWHVFVLSGAAIHYSAVLAGV